MDAWRGAAERGEILSTDEQLELKALVEAELRATKDRAAATAEELGR
jgi:hypothetical protein